MFSFLKYFFEVFLSDLRTIRFGLVLWSNIYPWFQWFHLYSFKHLRRDILRHSTRIIKSLNFRLIYLIYSIVLLKAPFSNRLVVILLIFLILFFFFLVFFLRLAWIKLFFTHIFDLGLVFFVGGNTDGLRGRIRLFGLYFQFLEKSLFSFFLLIVVRRIHWEVKIILRYEFINIVIVQKC